MVTQLSKLRKQILRQQGKTLAKHTRNPVSMDNTPCQVRKTPLMKLLEVKFSTPIEELIVNGDTIYELARKLEVDHTTISKWRKQFREVTFFKQFE